MEPFEKIKGILHENGIEVTVKQVPDKIHSLRNYYSAERRKEEAATKKSDPGQDDLYISKWLFFQPLSFLRNNLIPRVTETNLKRPQMETTQNPREGKISRLVLGKLSIQEKNNAVDQVAESIESISNNISTRKENPLSPETSKSKSEDEIFEEMTVKMVSGIPECEEKYLLKLRIQQDLINTRFSISRAKNTQDSMPLTSTNPSISIVHSRSFFLRRQIAVYLQVFEHFQ